MIPSHLNQLIDRLIRREDSTLAGIVTRDKDDAGGTTKWGISQRAYPTLDIPSLTLEQARDIYYRDYLAGFLPLKVEVLEPIFDTAVNQGVSVATRLAQAAVNVKVDGKLGPASIAAINASNPATFRTQFTLARLLRYLDTILATPSQRKYAKGWFKRALEHF